MKKVTVTIDRTSANYKAYEKMISQTTREIFCKPSYRKTMNAAKKQAEKKFPFDNEIDYTKI